MAFTEEILSGLAIYAVVSTVAGIKALSSMKEQNKTLFLKCEKLESDIKDLRKEKDQDIKEIKNELKSLSEALQEGNKNIVDMIHDLHIKLVENKKGQEP